MFKRQAKTKQKTISTRKCQGNNLSNLKGIFACKDGKEDLAYEKGQIEEMDNISIKKILSQIRIVEQI